MAKTSRTMKAMMVVFRMIARFAYFLITSGVDVLVPRWQRCRLRCDPDPAD
jgi:hypothetical protein